MAHQKKTPSKINTALLHGVDEALHFHQELELLYLMEGELNVTQDGRTFVMQKDDVLVINCNNAHALKGNGELSLLQIHICSTLLHEISPEGLLFYCDSAADTYHPYGEVRRVMRQLLLSYVGPRKKTPALRYSYIYALLDLLVEQFQRPLSQSKAVRPSRDEERLQAIVSYVSQNFREQISLGKLAEQMYLSTSSLSRLFKRSMGCYFADFVNRVRLNHAVQELVGSEKTVTRVAADCGFTNLAAFNKQFQSVYHTSPTAYRRQQWEEQAQSEDQQLAALEQEIQNLHLEAEPVAAAPGAHSQAVTIAAGEGTDYRRCWNQVLNGGSAYDMAISNIQGHIISLCQHLNFRYVRIWSLFSKQMMISQDLAKCHYNFDMLDNVLDFMVANRMVPYLDFGQRPVCAVKAEGEMVYYEDEALAFAAPADWLRLFRAFLEHIVRRYGREATGHWVYDFTVDIRQQTLSFCRSEEEMWDLYRQFHLCLRHYFSQPKTGGLGGIAVEDLTPTMRWLEYCKAHDCVPEHLSVLVFPYLHESRGEDYGPRRLAREGEEVHQIHRCRTMLDQLGLHQCKLHVVEWNNTLSTRNWLNDSCFRAAYALEVFNHSWGEADVMGVWMATDWCCSYYDTTQVANGGNGLISKDGIRKPVYHALDFLNRMGSGFLQRGDDYLATTSGPNNLYILCYNFKQYSYQYFQEEENKLNLHCLSDLFVDGRELQIRFTITGLTDKRLFALKRRTVNDEHGSLLGEWSRFEYDGALDAHDIQYLRNVCNPELSMRKLRVEKGELSFTASLKPHEITLFHIFELQEPYSDW